MRGAKLYDPRKDSTAGGSGTHRLAAPSTWEWSDCPALADADFLASAVYGMGVSVDWTTVAAAANANNISSAQARQREKMVQFPRASANDAPLASPNVLGTQPAK